MCSPAGLVSFQHHIFDPLYSVCPPQFFPFLLVTTILLFVSMNFLFVCSFYLFICCFSFCSPHMNENIWFFFFFIWLIHLAYIIVSRSNHGNMLNCKLVMFWVWLFLLRNQLIWWNFNIQTKLILFSLNAFKNDIVLVPFQMTFSWKPCNLT